MHHLFSPPPLSEVPLQGEEREGRRKELLAREGEEGRLSKERDEREGRKGGVEGARRDLSPSPHHHLLMRNLSYKLSIQSSPL